MGLLDPFEPRSSPPPHDFASSSVANLAPRSRKRSYLHLDRLDSYPSSDPACFSSDPPEPSQEGYSIGSRKRQFRGSWWNHDASPVAKETYKSPFARKTRKFKRDFDSGVFMPSDGSDESLPDAGPIQLSPLNRSKRRVVTPQDLAADIIEKCVRVDNEVVDLSDLNLETLDGRSLAVLNTITKTNKVIDRSEGNLQDDDYQPLQPQLQLYLANNGLSHLPLPLWHLDRLTVLSLRNNNIRVLPAVMAKLRNLVELNLTNNKLEHLPWELVRNIVPNGSLEKLIVSHNPLARPKADVRQGLAIVTRGIVGAGLFSSAELPPDYQAGLRKIAELNTSTESQLLRTEMLHMFERHCMPQRGPSEVVRAGSAPDLYCSSVSAISYFDECESQIYPSRLEFGHPVRANIDDEQARTSGARSLFDIALRSYVTQFDGYQAELDDWDLGTRVTQAITRATDTYSQHGLRDCSVCGRQYLIARTSWIEYHHRLTKGITGLATYNPDDLFLPMLRHGCSWTCLPDPALRKATFFCGELE